MRIKYVTLVLPLVNSIIFYLLMFENNIEKGLFTFYWEQSHKQNNNNQLKAIQQPNSQTKNNQKKKTRFEMEEKQVCSSKVQRHTKTKTQDLRQVQLHHVSPNEKQNRQYVLPNTLDISSKLAQSLKLKHSKSGQFKSRSNKHKHQSSCKLPLLKSSLSQDASQSQINHSSSYYLQKIAFKEQNTSMRQLTIKLQTDNIKPAPVQRGFCGKKTKKMSTKRAKRKNIDMQMSDNIIISDLRDINKSPRQLPVLSPRTLNKRAQKDSNILQKLMMQRMQGGNGYSSVINIGISSCDEYNQRWLKRKQQFMNILSKNMSGQISKE